MSAAHINTFFLCFTRHTHQGAHVTINARSEVDLEVDALLKLIAKSSGANYSVHKEKATAKFSADPQTGPVASTYTNSYKKEGAAAVTTRDAFWHTQEVLYQ